MPAPTDPYTFADGAGNTASGVQVNARFAPLYAAAVELYAQAAGPLVRAASDQASYTPPSSSYTAIGPTVAAPAAGDYLVIFGYNVVTNPGVATSGGYFEARHGAVLPVNDANAIAASFAAPQFSSSPGANNYYQSGAARARIMAGVTAGEAIGCCARYSAGGSAVIFTAPWIAAVLLRAP